MTKEYAIQILREMIPKFARCNADVKILTAIRMAINSLEERKTGKWIEHNDFDNSWECSVCNEVVDIIEGTPMDNEYRFCPWCGAEMKGGAE